MKNQKFIGKFEIVRAKNAPMFEEGLTRCDYCGLEMIGNEIAGLKSHKIFCGLCVARDSGLANEIPTFTKWVKLALGCEMSECAGAPAHAWVFEWAHIYASTKYRTKSGKIVEPSDLFRTCSLLVAVSEMMKCKVWCANCHRLSTARERGF